MKVGHVYVVYTTLAKPPKDKITVCICAADNLFFWINTNAQRHGHGQFSLTAADHAALSRECFLDCSRVVSFSALEMQRAQHRGAMSDDLLRRLLQFLRDEPPKTLSPKYLKIAVENLTAALTR